MAHLSPGEYDRLERAIGDGRRIAVTRRGRELVVRPIRLYMEGGREIIEAMHPTTGDIILVRLDDVEQLEIVAQ
jgi:predicted metalloprotease